MPRRLPETGSTLNQISHVPGLTRHPYQVCETRGLIITDKPKSIEVALISIREQRRLLSEYIQNNPFFQHSLEPVKIEEAPQVVKLMTDAASVAGVGPMAAVAGVIADLAAEAMLKAGAIVAIVENGGEAALHSDRPITISVGAGNNKLSEKIGFRITSFPIGVATSSGRHSHAFSMGDADTVTVFASTAGLADAASTAAANKVIGEPNEDVKAGVETALKVKGVLGALAIRDDRVSMGGTLPKIIAIDKKDE